MAFKSVKKRLEEWLPDNMPISEFVGTNADFQQYRQQWINNCAASVSTGLLQSKKNAIGQCQAAFDANTLHQQLDLFAGNLAKQQKVEEANEKLLSMIMIIAGALAFIALIYWLLK